MSVDICQGPGNPVPSACWTVLAATQGQQTVAQWVHRLADAVAAASGQPCALQIVGHVAEMAALTRLSWRIDAALFGACRDLAPSPVINAVQAGSGRAQPMRCIVLTGVPSGAAEVVELRVGRRPACEMAQAVDEAAKQGAGEVEISGVCRRGAEVVERLRWFVYLDERSRHRACENVVVKLVRMAVRLVVGSAGNSDATLAEIDASRTPVRGVPESLGPLARSFRHALRRVGWHDQWAITVFRDVPPEQLWPVTEGIDLIPPKDKFWADPFLFRQGDRLWVFFEELPFATERGHISVLSIDAAGAVSDAQVVLQPPWHLSYPNVFEHEGEIYMVPESGSQGNVVLYRAHAFPHDWRPVAELLKGVRAADATFFHSDGSWWLMCAAAQADESIYDQLFLYRADSPFGPFQPVGNDAVVVDTAAARPAGPVFKWQGRWVRPAQDCRRRYGRGLQLLTMQLAADGSLQQAPLACVEGAASGDAMGVHTYCRRGTDLAVDWYRWIPRLGDGRKGSRGQLELHPGSANSPVPGAPV